MANGDYTHNMSGNSFMACTTGLAMQTGGAVASANAFYNCTNGIAMQFNDCSVTGNVIYGLSTGSGTGIQVGTTGAGLTSSNSVVTGNRVTNFSTGINVFNSSCSKNIVTSNQLLGNTTALTDSGTSTVNANNVTV